MERYPLCGCRLLSSMPLYQSGDAVGIVLNQIVDAVRHRVGVNVAETDGVQQEREAISRRTREALAAARARGVKLGCPNGAKHLRQYGNGLAVKALKAAAGERASGLSSTIAGLKAEGVSSANAIAGALNARSIATPRGGKWTARSVLNLTARLS
jgi:hypothetical protein